MADDFDSIAATLVAAANAPEAPEEAAPPPDTPTEVAAEPAKVEETPAEAPKVEAKKDEPKDWKAIAAADKARRDARAATRQQQTQQQSELQETKAKLAKWEAFEKKKAEDPLAAAEEVGLSYDELTRRYIAGLKEPEADDPVKALTQKVQSLEAQIKNDAAAKQEAQYQANLQAIGSEIDRVAQADEFELVRTHPEGRSRAFAIMVAYHNETNGKNLPFETAVREAEKELERELLEPVLKTKKAQARLAAMAPPKKAEPAPTLSQALKQPSSTASNKDDLDQMVSIFNRLQSQEVEG